MKVGDLVKNRLKGPDAPIGIVISIKDDIVLEDVHCNEWKYPDCVRVFYASGEIEYNPVDLYELISIN